MPQTRGVNLSAVALWLIGAIARRAKMAENCRQAGK
jgi:hypothetical protein